MNVVLFEDENGTRVLFGPFATFEEAWAWGTETFDSTTNWEVTDVRPLTDLGMFFLPK
jgi:hypothetical protein